MLHAIAPLDPRSDAEIIPVRVDIAQSELDALIARLDATRWSTRESVADWSQGVPLERMKALIDYWRSGYDWRRCEAKLNSWPQYQTVIDGLGIHFLQVRSPHPHARPVIITHGWPGSVLEFLDVIDPLVHPTRHGGSADDACHLVIPSLPGYGFSDKPAGPGWGVERIACAWSELMARLGYENYVAQGGDWGSAVTRSMALQQVPGLSGIHLNMVVAFPSADEDFSKPEARDAHEANRAFKWSGHGYAIQQSTRPQTLAYALADSPAGQAAWIYEKFREWTDNGGDPEDALSRDAMLDVITLYWLTNSAASSAQLYWESYRSAFSDTPISLPVACSIFAHDIRRPPRNWAERIFPNIVYWNRSERGGHFAAFEQPEIFVTELRAALSALPR